MRLNRLLLVLGLTVAEPVLADFVPAPNTSYSQRADLLTDKATLWRGETVLEYRLESPADIPSLSIWYETSPSCQGFGISSVELLQGDEWIRVESLHYGESHFFRSKGITWNGIRLRVVQEQRLRMRCQIHVVGEDVELPEEINMLAKVLFTECEGEESLSKCVVQLQRLDAESAAPFLGEKKSSIRARLENNRIYRMNGYQEKNRESGTEEFVINSARQVFP
jgi:hypothetical protein